MKTLCFKGEVFSGKGEGAKFIRLPWARKQIEKKLGYSVFPGTLNVRLEQKSVNIGKSLKKQVGVEIIPVPGSCRGRLFKARLAGVKCAVLVPEIAGYPGNVVEVVAPVNLRETLHLSDGSPVEVEVTP